MTEAMKIQCGVSRRMFHLYVMAVVWMALHKVESWATFEWEVSPFFQWAAANVGSTQEGMFYAFITWLFVGLGCVIGVLWGPRTQQVLFGIYGLTFVEEIHHIVKAVDHGVYYPGLASVFFYLPLGVLYTRELLACVSDIPVGAGRAGLAAPVAGARRKGWLLA